MHRIDPAEPDTLSLVVCGAAEETGAALLHRLFGGEWVPADDTGSATFTSTGPHRRLVATDLTGPEDDPGNLAALAPRCDLAVLLADARTGLGPSARRQAAVARLLGVRHLVLAADLPARAEDGADVLARLAAEFAGLADPLGFPSQALVPIDSGPPASGRPPLRTHLEEAAIPGLQADAPFRMPVEEIRPDGVNGSTLRGTVAAGRVAPGDTVVAAGSGRVARVISVEARDGLRAAQTGESVTLRLDPAIDVAPGEMLAAADDRPESGDQFAARLLWLDAEPLLPGRAYRMRIGTRETSASVTRIKHRISMETAAPLAAGTLRAGDQGQVNLSLAESVVFEPFARRRTLGAFTLADRQSGRTVAAGTIDFALRRAANIHRQAVDVTKAARAAAKAQRPALLWFTGLSGAGKSTIANLVEKRLFALGHHTYLLDGDNVRHGLNRDLGFTAQDRVENIRRVAETAKLMVDAGLITLASFISPFRAERRLARDLLAAGEFIEVFVDAPLGVAEARDPKGLYAQARAGRIPNFTGIDSPYEPPEAPELHLETDRRSAEDLADEVVAHLRRAGFLAPDG